MQQGLDWAGVQALLAFSRTQKLSAAAQQLGVDETTIARQIKRLGGSLGTPLLRRNGTRLTLSYEGELVARAALYMDAAAAELSRLLGNAEGSERADVRVTGIAPFLAEFIAPKVVEFIEQHPGIRLDLIADDRNLGIAEREADIAIRYGRPNGSQLVGRRLATLSYAIFKGRRSVVRPVSPEPRWVQLSQSLKHLPETEWLTRNVSDASIVMRANSLDVLVNAVANGVGQALLPIALAQRHGRLKQVGTVTLQREVWLVYHQDDRNNRRIRAVADWLISVMKTLPKPE